MISDPLITAEPDKRIGRYASSTAGGETVRAYIPPPLPPEPPLSLEPLQRLLEEANQALGRLDGMADMLPDTSLFLYMYVRKEAVLSSQIEGTQSSLSDLLAYESEQAPGAPLDDVKETSRYVAAMEYGLQRMQEDFPLSLRLIREMHEILLDGARGGEKNPGEFRTSQNWIGGTRPGNAVYVPPPPQEVMPALGAFELFLHEEESNLPILVKSALMHAQFESIHPFLDGNGRIGRLLITLMLCANNVLKQPLLYLSLYFKENRKTYYQLLTEIRERGNWETWVEFFLLGVRDTSRQATEAMKEILDLFKKDRKTIETAERVPLSILRVHDWLQKNPLTTVEETQKGTGLSYATANAALVNLSKMDIVREITGGRRNRRFAYSAYLAILSRGTEPLKEGD